MPAVEPIPEGMVDFLWRTAADRSRNELIILTPGRNYMTSGELPSKDELTKAQVDFIKSIVPLDEQWRIAAIGMTDSEGFQADAYKAVPILSMLESLVQVGHAVILFEGHPSALKEICAGGDLLIVDETMVSFLQPDWMDAAKSVLSRPNVIQLRVP